MREGILEGGRKMCEHSINLLLLLVIVVIVGPHAALCQVSHIAVGVVIVVVVSLW